MIDEDLYLDKILRNLEEHTSPNHTEINFVRNDDDDQCNIELKITAKNYRNEVKNYGGDLFNARLILAYEDEESEDGDNKPKNASGFDGDFQTRNLGGYSKVIPGNIDDNLDGTYSVRFPKLFSGKKFCIEIILMQNSESITSLIRSMNGMHMKSRISKQIIEVKKRIFDEKTNKTRTIHSVRK